MGLAKTQVRFMNENFEHSFFFSIFAINNVKQHYRNMGDINDYIRFDWAIKRILRDKANFGVLEGLMTVLIGRRITIIDRGWRDHHR